MNYSNPIDEAIAKARARAALRSNGATQNVVTESTEADSVSVVEAEAPEVLKEKKREAKRSDLQRLKDDRRSRLEANRASRAAARALRKAEAQKRADEVKQRKAERAAKRAKLVEERAAKRLTQKDSKYEKLFSKLPSLSESGLEWVKSAAANSSATELLVMAKHLNLHARIKSEEATASSGVSVSEGDEVTILTCDDVRMVGKTGVVDKVRKLRCLVSVDGFVRPAYCFISDVKKVEKDFEQEE